MTSLQAKVEGLATTNALMKEDLSIARASQDKAAAENKRLRAELERLRGERRAEGEGREGQGGRVRDIRETGMKELSEDFRNRLQEEMTQREEAERQLERQNNAKLLMEANIEQLTMDTSEKQVRREAKYAVLAAAQVLICSLKGQLEDIKCINLEMYTKLAVSTASSTSMTSSTTMSFTACMHLTCFFDSYIKFHLFAPFC